MADLVLKNINELVTSKGKAPKCGADMKDIGIIRDGCITIAGGLITDVGKTADVIKRNDIENYIEIDCKDKTVLPGFVDSHTHFVFGGYRADEFAARHQGNTYMDLLKMGGGISSTVKSTRAASLDELIESGRKRLDSMLSFGVTTVEGKSGYGLDIETEIKQLKTMRELNSSHPVDIVSTFLGPHSVPEEYKGKGDEFIEFMIKIALPKIKENNLAEFVDIFCEKGVFNIKQSRKFLSEAKKMGFSLKLHADEIVQFGGAELAAELGAISADHLLSASEEGIVNMAEKGVIATLLPATAFNLKEAYADARRMIERGCAVALATDFNPGSSFTNSIPLIIALAALNMEMSTSEIITALTINGAAAIRKENEVGSIEPGKKADILILEYPSIDFLTYNTGINIVKTVIKNGEIVINRR